MSRIGLFNRLQKLAGPRAGTKIVCLSVDEQGDERFLWQLPVFRPSQILTIRIPPSGADPVFSMEELNDETF